MKKLLCCLFLLVASLGLVACQVGQTVSVESLEVSGYKEVYEKNESFTTEGLVVTAKLSNGTSLVVTDKATVVAPEEFGVVGTYEVNVTYDGVSTKFEVSIKEADLLGISVNTKAVKVSYLVGETFSAEGIVVEAEYSDKSKVAVSEYSLVLTNEAGVAVEGAFVEGGLYTAKVTYEGHNHEFAVNVLTIGDLVAAAVASGVENKSSVVSGTLSEVTEYDTYVYSYLFGENYFNYADEWSQYHYELVEEDVVFGAVESWGEVSLAEEEAGIMNGYKVNVFFYSAYYFGAEDLVSSLYALGVENNAVVEVNEGVYSFAFPYVMESWDSYYYIDVKVSFELGEAGEFSKVTYEEIIYYSDEVVVAEDGSWTVVEGLEKVPTKFIYEQIAGERTAVNPYTKSSLEYTSFDLVTMDGAIYEEGIYEISAGYADQVTLYIGNAYPETALPSFNYVECILTDVEGNPVMEESLEAYYASYDGSLTIYGKQPGTYVLTVTCGDITKQFTYVVSAAYPDYIAAQVYATNDWGYKEFTEMASTIAYVNKDVYFKAAFPEFTLNGYTAELAEAYEGVVIEAVDENSEPYEACYKLVATATGTYTIVLKSTDVESLTTELTIVVKDIPDLTNVFTGTYEYSSAFGQNFVVSFAPAEGLTGKVTINSEAYGETQSGVYSYAVENGVLTTEYVSGDILYCELVLTDDFTLAISNYGNICQLSRWSVYSELKDQYYQSSLFGNEIYVTFYPTGDGEFFNGRVSVYFSSTAVENEDGTFTITLVEEGIFVNNQVIVSADYKTLTASVDTGEIMELVFELPITPIAYGVWSNMEGVTLYLNEYFCYADYYGSYPEFNIHVTKNEDGSYTISFEITWGDEFIEGNVATLSAECNKITFVGIDGVTYELYQN